MYPASTTDCKAYKKNAELSKFRALSSFLRELALCLENGICYFDVV